MERYTGTIMWISERDGNGIILLKDKYEIYFDSSVFPEFDKAKRKDVVTFIKNDSIKHVNCAMDVKIA